MEIMLGYFGFFLYLSSVIKRNTMKNGTILLTSIASFGVAYSIMSGKAQEVVHFAGELNEIGCTVISLTMGVMCLLALDWKGLGKWLIS